jgi:hypothetical protein
LASSRSSHWLWWKILECHELSQHSGILHHSQWLDLWLDLPNSAFISEYGFENVLFFLVPHAPILSSLSPGYFIPGWYFIPPKVKFVILTILSG